MHLFDPYIMAMVIVFILGYFFITVEDWTKINKATTALLMAVTLWAIQFMNPALSKLLNDQTFCHHLSNISQIVFFLLSALTVVEIISIHHGFDLISNAIQTTSKRKILWVLGFIAFFLSAVLDNLTTTVVMISLLGKLMKEGEDRLLIGGAVVIAANAGGAWTPIGDVTTTMLWIGGQLSTLNIIQSLFFPSLTCMIVSFAYISCLVKGQIEVKNNGTAFRQIEPISVFVFYLGLALLVFVPIFKIVTGLPPFMGMLFALSSMWLITDLLHCRSDDRTHLRVPNVLSRIDLAGALFFLGILLAVNALDTAGILKLLASYLNNTVGNINLLALTIGIASAIVDNVPLVAATMGMYDVSDYPMNHQLWELIAYCAGTGGSILLIGSAAGVAFMGLDNVKFLWYMKRITIPAALGYFAGAGLYIILH